jgi:hypothetical protein
MGTVTAGCHMTLGHEPGLIPHERSWLKTLRYKPEGSGFEARGGELIFKINQILPAALGPGVHLASNRNEHHKQKNNVCGE